MPRYPVQVERDDGWSDWVQPLMDGYRMACCDCGLVHEMQFGVLKVKENRPGGFVEFEPGFLPVEEFRIWFRARRHNRATGQIRRRKKAAND